MTEFIFVDRPLGSAGRRLHTLECHLCPHAVCPGPSSAVNLALRLLLVNHLRGESLVGFLVQMWALKSYQTIWHRDTYSFWAQYLSAWPWTLSLFCHIPVLVLWTAVLFYWSHEWGGGYNTYFRNGDLWATCLKVQGGREVEWMWEPLCPWCYCPNVPLSPPPCPFFPACHLIGVGQRMCVITLFGVNYVENKNYVLICC